MRPWLPVAVLAALFAATLAIMGSFMLTRPTATGEAPGSVGTSAPGNQR